MPDGKRTLSLHNRQRVRRVDLRLLRRITQALLRETWPQGSFCLDEAVSQARRFDTTWQSELMRYIVHGVLHLLGYDDAAKRARQKMKAAEDTLVRQLARQFDIRGLGITT